MISFNHHNILSLHLSILQWEIWSKETLSDYPQSIQLNNDNIRKCTRKYLAPKLMFLPLLPRYCFKPLQFARYWPLHEEWLNFSLHSQAQPFFSEKEFSLQKDKDRTPQLLSFRVLEHLSSCPYCHSLPPYGIYSDKSERKGERKEGRSLSEPQLIQMNHFVRVFLHIGEMYSEEMFINYNS